MSLLQVYQADVSPTSGKVFTITSPSWFHHQGLAAGAKLKLEYLMTYEGQAPSVISINFNGAERCSGNPSTVSPATTTQPPISTSTSGPGGSCSSNTVTNSWANNVQGKLKFTVPSDISEFEIILLTDISLISIRVR